MQPAVEQERQKADDRNHDADQPLKVDYDANRQDNLMCFWITDFSAGPVAGMVRRMYVCVDPKSGQIIPQGLDVEYLPSP